MRSSPVPTDDAWVGHEHEALFLDGEFEVPESDLFEGQHGEDEL